MTLTVVVGMPAPDVLPHRGAGGAAARGGSGLESAA